MADATHDEVIAATRTWLRPVIQILLRSGITWREFAELARATYVEVASQHFGRRGRPTNVSRTAILTGLARRDVRKRRWRSPGMMLRFAASVWALRRWQTSK